MIPVREDLRYCVGLQAMPREAFPPIAGSAEDYEWAALIAELELESPATTAIRDYARRVQIRERGIALERDIAQEGVGATMCERLSEMNDLVERNNAEAERD